MQALHVHTRSLSRAPSRQDTDGTVPRRSTQMRSSMTSGGHWRQDMSRSVASGFYTTRKSASWVRSRQGSFTSERKPTVIVSASSSTDVEERTNNMSRTERILQELEARQGYGANGTRPRSNCSS
eukprot:5318610-Pyramimonas_sp.AAC.1